MTKSAACPLTAGPLVLALFLVPALFCGGLVACRSENEWQGERYELKGKVVHVDKKGSTVTLAHEEIPGYMEAMTMPFKLKDVWPFDVLAPGDGVHATLVVAGNRSRLEDIVITRKDAERPGAPETVNAIGPGPGDEVPDFSLVNQDGERIRLHQYRDRAVVLTFIYTRCPLPDYCPLMTERFADIDEAIKKDDSLYQKTHLLSISVDPDYDTPKVLRSYGDDNGLKSFEHWEFASGTRAEVKKIAEYFGLKYWPDNDQIIHSLRTAIIAPGGKLAKIYSGNEWKPADILADLENLLARDER